MPKSSRLRAGRVYLLLTLVCLLSIPWWATETLNGMLFGYPSWAVYSVAMSVLFALTIIAVIGRAWDRLALLEPETEETQRDA